MAKLTNTRNQGFLTSLLKVLRRGLFLIPDPWFEMSPPITIEFSAVGENIKKGELVSLSCTEVRLVGVSDEDIVTGQYRARVRLITNSRSPEEEGRSLTGITLYQSGLTLKLRQSRYRSRSPYP